MGSLDTIVTIVNIIVATAPRLPIHCALSGVHRSYSDVFIYQTPVKYPAGLLCSTSQITCGGKKENMEKGEMANEIGELLCRSYSVVHIRVKFHSVIIVERYHSNSIRSQM